MAKDTAKLALPPYVPYTTFFNFINGLKDKGIPSHIDKGVMSKMSGSGQTALTNSLKSMGLINSSAEPTQLLHELVAASEEDYSTVLAIIIKQTYRFLFDGSIDLATTASSKVQEKFQEAGAGGSTVAKCMQFFLAAAKVAGIKVSNYVKPPKLPAASRNGVKKPKKAGQQDSRESSISDEEVDDDSDDQHRIPEDMVKITVPLRDTADGIIFFPADMSDEQIKRAVKMADFILKNYYGLES